MCCVGTCVGGGGGGGRRDVFIMCIGNFRVLFALVTLTDLLPHILIIQWNYSVP